MMNGERASLFEDDSDFDISGFAPEPVEKPAAPPEKVRAVSEAANFRSREPTPAAQPSALPKREQRRRRTGRNVQLNIKTRPEAIEAFYAIADGQGWGLGEAFEEAIESLKRELARQK